MLDTLKYIITAFIPGASLLLTQHYRLGLAIPFVGLLWVLLLSATRIVVTPTGFSALIAGLLILHTISFTIGINKVKKIKKSIQPISQSIEQKNKTLGATSAFTLLLVVNLSIIVSCHIKKSEWFGFAFYYVPSVSMAPTLLVGDVIIADTWAYQKTTPLPNDIAIIKRSVNSKVLVKRVSKIRSNQYQTEIFIEGDNKKHSVDSHTYGWITDDYLIGKVKFVWVSLTNIKRNFVSAK